jgi:putative ABC transport system permease protein
VVLSHAIWLSEFGGDPGAIDAVLTIDGVSHQVVGVARPDFMYPAGASRSYEAFAPLVIPPGQRVSPQRGAPFLTAIGRLRPDVRMSQAQASMDLVAIRLRGEHPDWDAGVILQPYREYVAGTAGRWMRLLLWGVMLVFLIMCANVANLLLARGAARRRELGVRAALGASQGRIARQLVIESLLLALAGTALGLLLGRWMLELYRTAMPAGLPRVNEIAIGWRVYAAAAVATPVTGGFFGLAPAVFSTRVDLSSALQSGGASPGSTAGSRLRGTLIVGEIAIAFVLLVGAILFTTSFLKVAAVPLGLDYAKVVVVTLNPPVFPRGIVKEDQMWTHSEQFHDLAARLVARVRSAPGLEQIAATSGTPFSGGNSTFSFELPGRPDFTWSRDRGMVAMKMVSPGYLELLRIPLLRGRYLSQQDSRSAEGAIVVSESAARLIWPGEDPLGQEIDLQKRLRVVGVVADVRMGGPEAEPYPDVYVPFVQGRGTYASTLVMRTALPPEQMLTSVRAAVQEVDPAQRLPEVTTLEARLSDMLAQRRFNMMVVGSFGLIAVLIATIGLYAVVAYLVTQRRHEIGVRMALGASHGHVLTLVLTRAALLIAAGLAIGVVGVWQFAAIAQGFLFQLDPLDARVLVGSAVVMALTAFAASLIPARRAASIDPLIALRTH